MQTRYDNTQRRTPNLGRPFVFETRLMIGVELRCVQIRRYFSPFLFALNGYTGGTDAQKHPNSVIRGQVPTRDVIRSVAVSRAFLLICMLFTFSQSRIRLLAQRACSTWIRQMRHLAHLHQDWWLVMSFVWCRLSRYSCAAIKPNNCIWQSVLSPTGLSCASRTYVALLPAWGTVALSSWRGSIVTNVCHSHKWLASSRLPYSTFRRGTLKQTAMRPFSVRIIIIIMMQMMTTSQTICLNRTGTSRYYSIEVNNNNNNNN